MIANILSIAAYAVVVSQPLAYLVFLGRAQRELAAPAYIELRQRINAVMNRRLPAIYLAAIAATALLLAIAIGGGRWTGVAAVAVALGCLVADIVMAMRVNVPINEVMDRWSTADYPADWQGHRDRWFAVFRRRQFVLLTGFVSLLFGALV